MNRPIKFRAWVDEKMITDFLIKSTGQAEIYSVCTNVSLCGAQDCGMQTERRIDKKFVMQYTGLLDKRGKEIYEGDIASVNYEGEKETYEIKWFGEEEYPAFDFKNWDGDSNGLSEAIQGSHIEIEVVGNIYENKDLLK